MYIVIFLLLVIWFTVESGRLIGSEDPTTAPLITLGSQQIENELIRYDSIGFSQVYHLKEGNEFVSGEFILLGAPAEQWGDYE